MQLKTKRNKKKQITRGGRDNKLKHFGGEMGEHWLHKSDLTMISKTKKKQITRPIVLTRQGVCKDVDDFAYNSVHKCATRGWNPH